MGRQQERVFRDPNALTDTQKKVLELSQTGLCPKEIACHMPTFQPASINRICTHLRSLGHDIPHSPTTPWGDGCAPPMPPKNFDPRRATLEHLLDLKRAGHTTFLYRLRCEYRIRPGKGDRAIAPPLNFSGMGSPAAMCAAEGSKAGAYA